MIERMPLPFDDAAACRLADELFGLTEVSAKALPSYADQNFALTLPGGERRVLKIARADEDAGTLGLQNAVMQHLHDAGVPAPRPLPGRSGELLANALDPDGGTWSVRLVTFVEGRTLASLPPPAPPLLADFGAFLGRLDRTLLTFEHPWAERELAWDLSRAPAALAQAAVHEDAGRRALVEGILARFADEVLPHRGALRPSMLHNDANDHNVLLDPAGTRVVALIDYGDVVRAPLCFDPAIALAYLVLERDDPLQVMRTFLAGYGGELPLGARELGLLPLALAARLAFSVTSSALERKERPDDAYICVTEPAAWRFLEQLAPDTLDAWSGTLATDA